MNELEFKRHLKDLVHGHHHPEEHDWDRAQGSALKKPGDAKVAAGKRQASRKAARRK